MYYIHQVYEYDIILQMNKGQCAQNRSLTTTTFFIAAISLLLGLGKCVCPGSAPFALGAACYAQCPWESPNKYYKHYATDTCELTCPGSYYGFDGNRTCVDPCPSTPTQTYYDVDNKRCVDVCPANRFGYLGTVTASNQFCVSSCPSGTFANFDSNLCVETCPTDTFYMDGAMPNCTSRCPSNHYGSPVDLICKEGSNCQASPVPYFADDTTNLCVEDCPTGYYADTSTRRCLVYCSDGYFGDDSLGIGICVQTCPQEYFRDQITRRCLRVCPESSYIDTEAGNCTTVCPDGTFGDITTKVCVERCPISYYGDPTVNLCSRTCSYGRYADNYTHKCVLAADCYANTVGDPTTYKCVNITNCPGEPYYFANLVSKLCEVKCSNSLWGDKTSKMCLSACPWNPPYYISYQNSHTRQCVERCPEVPIHYADNYTKACVAECTQPPLITYETFADPVSQRCVEVCPNGFYSQSEDHICVSECQSNPTVLYYYHGNQSCIEACPEDYYADISKQVCTQTCPEVPSYFGYDPTNKCIDECPEGYFADESTRRCVEACPDTTGQYGDISTNYCVDVCPMIPDLFGQDLNNGNRTCVLTCDEGLFADPLTRTCVETCNMEKGYYGDQDSNRCQLQCESGTFADSTTGKCVSTCPRFPKYYYGNPVNKFCVLRCPEFLYANNNTMLCGEPEDCQAGYYADDFSQKCVAICPYTQNTFGETATRRCVAACQEGQFADPTTRKCSASCNATARLYKDPSTKTCVISCPSIPALYANPLTMTCNDRCTGNYFAYDVTRKCVQICPTTPAYYGDENTHRCVQSCPMETYKYTTNSFRGCVDYCPARQYTATHSIDMYADNSTWSCVPLCPESQNLYNFKHPSDATIRTCVKTCPMVGAIYYFAEDETQSCVTTCPSLTYETYGDIFTFKCTATCSRDQYRDILSKRCTYFCSEGLFADNSTWTCVEKCPVGTFGETVNNTCVKDCPTGFYAEEWTRMCRSDCLNRWFNYGENTTDSCVRECPSIPNLFANPYTRTCQFFCTGDRFADNNTHKCELATACTDGQAAELNTRRCTDICPIEVPSFLKNQTNQCVEICDNGTYADNSTMICVDVCPSQPDFYASNHPLLKGICVLYCPENFYRHTPTRECLEFCPRPDFFRDTLTMSCVETCPDYFYADNNTQLCVSDCSVSDEFAHRDEGICVAECPDPLFADPTTHLCVLVCPFGYYGLNNVCEEGCLTGFSDPILKLCVDECSDGYFARDDPIRQCVKYCEPYYALLPDKICVADCPLSSNSSENMYYEPMSFTCVNVCLPGYYADNLTRSCRTTCSVDELFADNSTGLCVETCPETPDYYGFDRVCYEFCPQNYLFAENQTRQCLQFCPNGSFADSNNRRCMDVCTGVQYAHTVPATNPVENVCLYMCPEDFWGYWGGDNVTKECVDVCPNGTYGENTTNTCVEECPQGSFADDFEHLCVLDCSAARDEFADPSTNRCVRDCPSVPSLYAQIAGRKCVKKCEDDDVEFRFNVTRACQTYCPEPYFADPVTDFCVFQCPVDENLYADNLTRWCKPSCPNVTAQQNITYADDSTKRCVFKCPDYPKLYGYNLTNKCLPNCPNGQFGDNDTNICHDVCFWGQSAGPDGVPKFTYADSTTNFCVERCPRNWFADNRTVICTDYCSEGTYADNSTWRCVAICPVNPLSYAYNETRVCVYECPDPYFGNEDGRQCNNFCPITPFYYYRDYQNHRCVKNCTYPYFADTFSQSCSTVCQFGYFENLGEHTCEVCPSSCISCVAALNCTACQPGLYMSDGECIESCPTFPVRYFANDLSSNCVEQCEPPYFGFLGTGKCQIECPETYYSDVDTGTCVQCPTGCRYCLNTNCSACLDSYIYSEQTATCSEACNSTHIYFIPVSGEFVCSDTCVAGTFLLSDLVTCQACSTSCLTCSNVGTNCTKCADKFWYNYMCVDECPSSFFADADSKCQYCGDSNEYCTLPPLSYTIETYTKNYKLYARVIFNRAVEMNIGEFIQYVQIRSSNKAIKPRDFLAKKSSTNIYTVEFLDSASLNEMSLFIGFAPGFVVDSQGNGLTTLSQATSVQTVTTIDEETEAETEVLKKRVNVLSWILVAVIILLMIYFSYPLLVLIDTIQAIYMHTFLLLSPLPYMWFNVNEVLGYSHFNFLPKVYSYDTTTTSEEQPYNLFIADSSFLGNMSPFIFIVSIYVGIFLFFLGYLRLMKRFFPDKCPSIQEKVRKIYKGRMKYSFLFQPFYYTLTYIVFFAVYQFKGYNKEIPNAKGNTAMAIVCLITYLVFFIFILYLSFKTRNKFPGSVPQSMKKKLEKKEQAKLPHKFSFLVSEPSFFPLEIAIRCFLKFCFCVALMIENSSAQLILFMIFNLIFFVYVFIFKPSIYKVTNRLNMFLSLSFIALQVVLFMYTLSGKTSENQLTSSIACLAIQCVMIGLILLWAIYRLVILIMKKCFGKVYEAEGQHIDEERKKKYYGKINGKNRMSDGLELNDESITAGLKSKSKSKNKKSRLGESNDNIFQEKQFNFSELNLEDEEGQDDEPGSVDADHLIKEFAYHFVPQKTEGQKNTENKLLGEKEKSKKHRPIVIEIDEDELVEDDKVERKKQSPERVGSRQKRTGHLRIEENSSNEPIDEIDLSSMERGNSGESRRNLRSRERENEVIWSQLDMESEHGSHESQN